MHLTWKKHIEHINKRISHGLFAIRQIKHFIPKSCLRTIYFAIIHPIINYGITAWGNAKQKLLHQTTVLQKRAVRYIHNVPYNSHTDILFKQSKILKLNLLYEYEVGLFMFKYDRKLLPTSFSNVFQYQWEVNRTHTTRNINRMVTPKPKSEFVNVLPLFNFPKIWNKHTQIVQTANGLSHAKRILKSHLLN